MKAQNKLEVVEVMELGGVAEGQVVATVVVQCC